MPVYCITGANRGIGLELVRQLARDPANTILALCRTPETGRSNIQEAAGSSKSVHVLQCDVGDLASIKGLAKSARETLAPSGSKIDVLINNAGIGLGQDHSSLDFEPELLWRMMRVNVVGPAKVTSHLQGAGLLAPDVRVVNISSHIGSITNTLGGWFGGADNPNARVACGYAVTKAGLNMMNAHMAGDLRARAGLSGAVVVAVCPGWVQTDMGGPDAHLKPEVSIAGVLKVIGGLGDDDNGKFFSYDGSEKAW